MADKFLSRLGLSLTGWAAFGFRGMQAFGSDPRPQKRHGKT